ncbi:GlxA family transcriptional regulator [Kineosporia sp. NBRC 101731]|uniref:GlxA family transcriptional regulator n=1 Tax=Kineosporia sp. NBRC 101731 TaxID=3032199 RepID=UPI00255247F1|nr:GlxA family transcriptional regulator [Kineosporia sp. NBRC 101731]
MAVVAVRGGRLRIGVLVFDYVKMLDFAGPAEVFVEANQTVGNYEVVLISPDGKPVHTSIGARVEVMAAAADVTDIDTLVVPGSECAPPSFVTPAVLEATALLVPRARRVTSICSGAFVLAALGLLDGRRATTHWKFTKRLAKDHPRVLVEPDSIFVRDGNVYSSAGVVAGIDLGLALVEEDHGADAARRVAQSLLVYLQRAGGQSQFSAQLAGPAPRTPVVRLVVDLIQADPAQPFTAQKLADHARVSVRHLARMFREELDSTPMEYLASIRFEAARAKLDAGSTVAQAALLSGYGTAESLRRAFIARLGISPLKYQQRFRSTTRSGLGAQEAR